jgi:site-specific recombinase XerD
LSATLQLDSRAQEPVTQAALGIHLKRRGRPPGAKAQVIRDARALGIHHFAFVRSSLWGLDLAHAFERYLAWSETTTDLRYVQNRRDALLKQIIDAGRHLNASLPDNAKITHMLDLLRSDREVAAAVTLPTLEQWVESEGMDPDVWSEADLIAEYQSAFGLDNADDLAAAEGARDVVAERVRALNHLSTLLAVTPGAQDRLEMWIAKSVALCLRNVGLLTLADLVNFINVHGYRWHNRVKGFGNQRAEQVVAWLRMQYEHLNMLVADSVNEPKSLRALKTQAQTLEYGLAKLPTPYGRESFDATVRDRNDHGQLSMSRLNTAALLGGTTDMDAEGEFRSHMANTLGASNDLEAVTAWLLRYQDKPSTQRSYRKEVERFMLWCAQDLQKPLSSVNSPDCQKYRDFLRAVPGRWIFPLPVPRSDPQWRAFRGQPSPSSQKQALVILQTMFAGLCDAGYLVANPMRALLKGFDLPATKIDIRRSFTEAEWQHVLRTLDTMPDSPERVRLKCILELLVSSGLRLDELASARHSHLRREHLPELPDLPDAWILTVTGKRNKTREVPLTEDVVRLLASHGREFMQEDQRNPVTTDLPLIRTLHASVAQWGRVQAGERQGDLITTPRSVAVGTAMSAAGIYAVLKRFFAQAAKTAGAAGLEPERFLRASTHWMRHTFVRQALVDGVPIEVVSELAGHASINTTSIYSTQELARKVRAVHSMKRRTLVEAEAT